MKVQTCYSRIQWNDLIRIDIDDIDDNKIYFELGYILKGSSDIFYKWKYEVNNNLELRCTEIIDKDVFISAHDIKYNIWHTLRCENLEKYFPIFAKDLKENFEREEWTKIIIEVFPSISSYIDDIDIIDDIDQKFKNVISKDWIQHKRKENWNE